MGIDISAKLIYGLPYNELVKELDEDRIEEVEEMFDYGEVDYASPFYDSPREEWIVGYEIFKHKVFYDEIDKLIESAKLKWHRKFPMGGRIIVSADVT